MEQDKTPLVLEIVSENKLTYFYVATFKNGLQFLLVNKINRQCKTVEVKSFIFY